MFSFFQLYLHSRERIYGEQIQSDFCFPWRNRRGPERDCLVTPETQVNSFLHSKSSRDRGAGHRSVLLCTSGSHRFPFLFHQYCCIRDSTEARSSWCLMASPHITVQGESVWWFIKGTDQQRHQTCWFEWKLSRGRKRKRRGESRAALFTLAPSSRAPHPMDLILSLSYKTRGLEFLMASFFLYFLITCKENL